MEEDFFLAEMAWLSEVGSYFGGPLWGEGEDGALMLREMEMGVVVWDFFRAGGTPPLGEEVWEDFLEGLLSAGIRFSLKCVCCLVFLAKLIAIDVCRGQS